MAPVERCPLCEMPIASTVDALVEQGAWRKLPRMRFHAACHSKFSERKCLSCEKPLGADFVIFPGSRTGHHLTCAEAVARARAEAEQRKIREKREFETEQVTCRALGMLPQWTHARVDSPVLTKCPRPLQTFARSWRGGAALLLGPSGCGKTTAVIAAMHQHVGQLRKSAEVGTGELPREFRAIGKIYWVDGFALANCRRNHALGQGDPEVITEAKRAWITVIDELGFESREASPDVFDVVNTRYANAAPTIVTSGCTLEQFIDRYGGALVRRLAEDGIGKLVDCHEKAKNAG